MRRGEEGPRLAIPNGASAAGATVRVVDLAPFFVTLALIIPAELPDKTFIATLVLSTRYRPVVVWLGVSTAFAVQTTIAVAAGQLLALLPERPVQLVTPRMKHRASRRKSARSTAVGKRAGLAST